MRIICVNTGKKYTQWHTDNLKHMIDQYSGLKYDEFVCMDTDLYDGVFNKLIIFDRFRDGENIFFDLDVVIYNTLPDLVRKDLTLVHCWWRDKYHTPLNSSIMSFWKPGRANCLSSCWPIISLTLGNKSDINLLDKNP